MTTAPADLDQNRENRAEPELGSPWQDLRAYVALPRLVSLHLSPAGDRLLAGVQTLDVDRTAYTTALWSVDPTGERRPRRLTRGVEGETVAAFLRDGSVVFTSRRPVPKQDEESSDQDGAVWCLPAQGGEAYVLARRTGGFQGVLAARGTDRMVCSIGMRAGIDDLAEDARRAKQRRSRKVEAILHEGVGVRYWDHDLGSETTRFLAADLDADSEPELTADDLRLVHEDLGRGLDDGATLSSAGDFLVTGWAQDLPRGDRRDSLVRLDLADGRLTHLMADDQEGEYEGAVLSDDDQLLACVRSVPSTPSEAPHAFLHLLDLTTGEHRDLAPDWKRWGHPLAFSPDTSTLYVSADEDGEHPVFAVDVADGQVRRLTDHGAFSSVQLSRDGRFLFALRSAWDDPGSIVRIDTASGETVELSAPVEYPELPGRLERVETTAADGTRVPGWLALPAEASASQPAPLALWIHGGPLNSWNAWSWRWCPWLLVSQGYAVLLPDPALSTGYGHEMIQRGWGRWGEEPYTDLMAATDAVVAREDIDEQRTVAMGGSFGGYMANWVAGQTDRFRCIVSHASLWNLTSFGPTTDAPWFWGRELSPEMIRANSPHQFADRITTPMLVVHGDKDYRVPIGEGLSLWWALVHHFDGHPAELPHKFLYFPDENHWVLSPQHAIIWYETVRAFLATHVEGAEFIRSEVL
ncbi:S9 family peptidase [Luteococcus peritonei]|uniref:Acyl-peptide hydrolase n=1 Tax=Luteococcus peritonei TaxID=88874 RepID=A0ABW4RVQ1_9ACTN